MKNFLPLLMAGLLSACGSQPMWDGVEMSGQNDCARQSANSNEYTACMERLETESRKYEQGRTEGQDQQS